MIWSCFVGFFGFFSSEGGNMSATREAKLVAAALRDIARQGRSFVCTLEKCQVHCAPLLGTSMKTNHSKTHIKFMGFNPFCRSYSDCSDICPKRKSFMV